MQYKAPLFLFGSKKCVSTFNFLLGIKEGISTLSSILYNSELFGLWATNNGSSLKT